MRDHPRSRGENYNDAPHALAVEGSSPLTRGKRSLRGLHRGHERIIPAHAGKTSPPTTRRSRTRDHPRSRGENCVCVGHLDRLRGSSPLTRGKLSDLACGPGERRIIPAHAGKTPLTIVPPIYLPDHPRSRGENAWCVLRHVRRAGSSPLTRGKPLTGTRGDLRRRIIPAHAGKTCV